MSKEFSDFISRGLPEFIKPGMRIICTNNTGYSNSLTVGKQYTVEDIRANGDNDQDWFVVVRDDQNVTWPYSWRRFTVPRRAADFDGAKQ